MPRARARLRFARSASPSDEPTIGGHRFSDGDINAQIASVAEKHAPEGGYGETSWNAGTKTVFWNHADWTSNDEHDAAEKDFLAIDGVENFDCDSEANTPEGEGWEQVWPEPGSEAAYERVLALAMRPIDPREFISVVPARVHYRPATTPGQSCGTCSAYDDGHCTMFAGQPSVEENHVCDEWSQRANT